MRVQAEHGLIDKLWWALHDLTDIDVSVLHGRGELAGLEWRPHASVFARRYVAAEDNRFGSPADTTVKCPYTGFPGLRCRKQFAAQLAAARRFDPERERIVPTHRISVHHGLLRNSLACILPAGLTVGVIAQLCAIGLKLDSAYLAKTVAVFAAGAAVVLIGLPR